MGKKRAPTPIEEPPLSQVTESAGSTPSSPLPAILTALRSISSNDIYTMASKEFVVRGYEYHRQQRVRHYMWSQDYTMLTAQVQGTRLYSVQFSLHEGYLQALCDCPAWHPDWLCKHVLCACFTTKHVLLPEAFMVSTWPDTRRTLLQAELLDDMVVPAPLLTPVSKEMVRRRPPDEQPAYEIVIDARTPRPELLIHRDGIPLSRGWAPMIPSELLPLLNGFWYSGLGDDPFLRYLTHAGTSYPIRLITAQDSIPLRWCKTVSCRSKTELDVVGTRILVRAVCLAEGKPLTPVVYFRNFVADINGGRLLYLKNDMGWASFHSLRQRFAGIPFPDSSDTFVDEPYPMPRPNGPTSGRREQIAQDMTFSISLDEFQTTQVEFMHTQTDRILRHLTLKFDGHEAPLERPASPAENGVMSYVLILKPPSNEHATAPGSWTLQAQCRRGHARFAPSMATFGFIPALERGRAVSGALRAKKRKTVLYETFFAACSIHEPKERERLITTTIGRQDWPRAVSGEAVRWLKQHLSTYAREDIRLQLNAGRWELRRIEKAKEVLLYHIPLKVFGPDVFRGIHRFDEITIDPQQLFDQLPALLETLTAAGVELLYHDTPLRSSRWDCSIHVDRGDQQGTGLDWFEIRPEIRCDHEALSESEWRTALQQGGLVHINGHMRVLDRHTVERLRAILSLTEPEQAKPSPAEIVRVPRLQILDWLTLREQGITVSLPAEDEAILARLLRFRHMTAPPLPRGLRATLRPYQQDGYTWLAFLYEHRFGACLADDMGLGKTLQAICLLAAVQEGRIRSPLGAGGPHLVVAPTSLLFNWEQELERFAPALTVHRYTGGGQPLDAKDGDVVLATYGTVRRNIEVLRHTGFHIIVFDEAQAVKNILAETTAAVRTLRGRFKLTLTGTPLENHLGEYFSIIDLCMPGLLGEYERFRTELMRAGSRMLDRLLRRTRPFILRRTKAEILHDLPPKIESEVLLDLNDRQKSIYQQTVAQVRSTIDEAYRTKTPGQAQFIALTAILKLRQVCLSPRLLTRRHDEPSPKLRFLLERLPVLLDEGHSALVFSQFTGFLDLVEEACAKHELPYHRLDGSTTPAARKGRVTAFQSGEQPSVFLLSLKAGGQGLNLTKASYVFHLDPWWNPAVENQASDRAHRIGQQHTVSIVRILMRHSIEEKMMALKQRKLELYDAVMAGVVRGSGQHVLTKNDFEFLLSPSVQ